MTFRSADPAWRLDAEGWITGIQRLASPNFDERPPGTTVDLLVLHAISLPPGVFGGDAIIDFFCNRLDPAAHPFFASIADRRVSAHFLVRREGSVIQFVSCHRRAWHAGRSCWRGRDRCNDFSLGIEIEGDERVPFDPRQYEALSQLLRALRASFPVREIVAHADIAPARKTDPGPQFDWQWACGATATA